jgi:hypothetical protein
MLKSPIFGHFPQNLSPDRQVLLRTSRFGKILLGDLGIENGKLRMENY